MERKVIAMRFLVMFLMLLAACDASEGRNWTDNKEVVGAVCTNLCRWDSDCGTPHNGSVKECVTNCVTMACAGGQVDCGAEPPATDDQIDACISTLYDHSQCGNAIGISDACQRQLFPSAVQ